MHTIKRRRPIVLMASAVEAAVCNTFLKEELNSCVKEESDVFSY